MREFIVSVRQLKKATQLTGDFFGPIFAGSFSSEFEQVKLIFIVEPVLFLGAKLLVHFDFGLNIDDREGVIFAQSMVSRYVECWFKRRSAVTKLRLRIYFLQSFATINSASRGLREIRILPLLTLRHRTSASLDLNLLSQQKSTFRCCKPITSHLAPPSASILSYILRSCGGRQSKLLTKMPHVLHEGFYCSSMVTIMPCYAWATGSAAVSFRVGRTFSISMFEVQFSACRGQEASALALTMFLLCSEFVVSQA